MRRGPLQSLRLRRSQWLLLPKLPIRSAKRECTRGEKQVRISKPLLAPRDVMTNHTLLYRCARNCFMCPNCRNTLSVVPSDPADTDDGRSLAAVGEPPFFLYCSYCRWDSAQVDITFEKPTGLAGASFVLTFICRCSIYMRVATNYPQLNCRSLRTRRPSRLNSSVLKSTLSPSYVHPLPPPTSPATHTLRTLTLRRSTPSQPQRLLRWRAISQASESTPLLRAAGATRVRGMRFPSIAAVLRLGAQRRAPTWISCGVWRKCPRWRHSASDGRTAGRRRYAPGICASLFDGRGINHGCTVN